MLDSQPFTNDIDVGVGQLRALDMGWVVAVLVIVPSLPYLHHQGKFPSIALAKPPNAAISRRQGQLSCSYDLGSAHLCSQLQSQLYWAAQARCRVPSSPKCWSWQGAGLYYNFKGHSSIASHLGCFCFFFFCVIEDGSHGLRYARQRESIES